jgi:uncharacterized OB-fold protein
MAATRSWRLRKQRYSLRSESCPVCATIHFPPREVCSACGAPQHLRIVAALPALTLPVELFTAAEMKAWPGQRTYPS